MHNVSCRMLDTDSVDECFHAASPRLVFCMALLSTVDAFQTRPNQQLSVDCAYTALSENRTDLLIHWISQQRYDTLTYRHISRLMGNRM